MTEMSELTLATPCPACAGEMAVGALACSCGIRVEGYFATNEFAALGPGDLHLLRVFVMCDGRIRVMEAALGVSYPTVKSRIRALKDTLRLGDAPEEGGAGNDDSDIHDVFDKLESGAMSADDAIGQLKDS